MACTSVVEGGIHLQSETLACIQFNEENDQGVWYCSLSNAVRLLIQFFPSHAEILADLNTARMASAKEHLKHFKKWCALHESPAKIVRRGDIDEHYFVQLTTVRHLLNHSLLKTRDEMLSFHNLLQWSWCDFQDLVEVCNDSAISSPSSSSPELRKPRLAKVAGNTDEQVRISNYISTVSTLRVACIN